MQLKRIKRVISRQHHINAIRNKRLRTIKNIKGFLVFSFFKGRKKMTSHNRQVYKRLVQSQGSWMEKAQSPLVSGNISDDPNLNLSRASYFLSMFIVSFHVFPLLDK